MRVDKRKIYNVSSLIHSKNGLLVQDINGDLHPEFFTDAMKGNTLRIKMDFDKPVILRFSLQGFTAAFYRCMDLLDALESSSNPDEQYFYNDNGKDSRNIYDQDLEFF